MRFGDFSRSTRAHSLPFPTDSTESILAAVRDLIDQSRPRIEEKELTLIGVSLGNLARADTVQMELPIGEQEERGGRDQAALDQAVDVVRSRFGDGVIKRASMIDADQGVPVPTLPDSDNSA
jgi:DNA polymerase-4